MQHLLAGGVAAGLEQPVIGEQQYLAGALGHHRYRAGQAGAAQHIAKDAPCPHVGDGQVGAPRRGTVGLNGAREHHPHPAVGVPGLHQRFAPAITAHHGAQIPQEHPQGRLFQPGKE